MNQTVFPLPWPHRNAVGNRTSQQLLHWRIRVGIHALCAEVAVAGILPFGLKAVNPGVCWSPFPMLTGMIRYSRPTSASMMVIFFHCLLARNMRRSLSVSPLPVLSGLRGIVAAFSGECNQPRDLFINHHGSGTLHLTHVTACLT